MTQAAVESPRLTWAGTGDGVRPCPVCERATSVVSATSAQGLARCPYPDCGEQLYIRLGYEWMNGQARLFRDEFTLEGTDAFRDRYLREYRPGLFDYLLGRWRTAAPLAAGVWAVLVGVGWLFRLLRPSLPLDLWQIALPLLAVVWFAVSIWTGRGHVLERVAWHRRKRTWAERILNGDVAAELEAAPPAEPRVVRTAVTSPSPS